MRTMNNLFAGELVQVLKSIDETLKEINHTMLVNQELINTNYKKLYSIDLILKDMCLAIENIKLESMRL